MEGLDATVAVRLCSDEQRTFQRYVLRCLHCLPLESTLHEPDLRAHASMLPCATSAPANPNGANEAFSAPELNKPAAYLDCARPCSPKPLSA